MDKCWVFDAIAILVMLTASEVWMTSSYRSVIVDICHAENRKIYCTCNPDEYDIRQLDCMVFGQVETDDAVWKALAVNADVEGIRLSARPEGQLKYLPPALFNNTNLKLIYVRHADIGHIPSMAFRNSTSTITIDLSSNVIKRLDPQSVAHLPKLEELTLSDNELSVISVNTFEDLPTLKMLFLDRNKITEIESGALADLVQLSELDLSSNLLTSVKPATFKGLANLQRVDLGKNRIQHLGPNAFQHCPAVREIVLRENAIKTVDKHAFKGLHNLYTLYISRNQLSRIHPSTFKPLTNVVYLDLRYNQLTTLTENTVAPFNLTNNVTRIYLADNKFECDCRIHWMLDMLRLRRGDYVSEWKEVNCIAPHTHPTAMDDGWTQDDPHVNTNVQHKEEDELQQKHNAISLEKAEAYMIDCPRKVEPVEDLGPLAVTDKGPIAVAELNKEDVTYSSASQLLVTSLAFYALVTSALFVIIAA